MGGKRTDVAIVCLVGSLAWLDYRLNGGCDTWPCLVLGQIGSYTFQFKYLS